LVEKINLDKDLQSRQVINQEVIEEYRDAMKSGEQFPAAVIFFDGLEYWLADGFHRVLAAREAGISEIEADIQKGMKKDALLYSVSANATHGLKRSQADKRKAVMSLLNNPDFTNLSNRELGRLCKVDDKTVAKYRHELTAEFRTEFVYSQEVVDFFNGYLWLSQACYEAVGKLPGFKDEFDSIFIPETERATKRLKQIGIEEISSPMSFYGISGTGLTYQIATSDGCLWWIVVLQKRESENPEEENELQGYTNEKALRGFDMLIWWMHNNIGWKGLPSQIKDLVIGSPPTLTEKYWENILVPESISPPITPMS
jgi:hypothetical protein